MSDRGNAADEGAEGAPDDGCDPLPAFADPGVGTEAGGAGQLVEEASGGASVSSSPETARSFLGNELYALEGLSLEGGRCPVALSGEGGNASSSSLQRSGSDASASQSAEELHPWPPPSALGSLEVAGAAEAAASTSGASLAPAALPDAAAELWRHPKHVFVFSNAGKPIYSYRGSEEELAGLMATAQAILAVVQSQGQALKQVRAGRHVIAFLERPPLCLVAASALAEPPAVLRMQLTLVHGQIVSLLTSSAISGILGRSPGYDLRKLLGGSSAMLTQLIDSFYQTPAALLGACPSLPLLAGVRATVGAALAAAIKATGVLFGLVTSHQQLVCSAAAAGAPALQQWDLLLLLNFLAANESFRHSGEALTPICLPLYNPAANLHAYVHYTDAATQTAIVLLCAGLPDVSALSSARQQMQQQLEGVGALQAVAQAASEQQAPASGALLSLAALPPQAGGGAFGATALLHFAYKLTSKQQFVMAPFTQVLAATGLQQSLVVAYSQLRAGMFEAAGEKSAAPLQRLRYEVRPRFVLLGAASPDSELYLALDPLADEAEASSICSRLGMWLRARHDMLFG